MRGWWIQVKYAGAAGWVTRYVYTANGSGPFHGFDNPRAALDYAAAMQAQTRRPWRVIRGFKGSHRLIGNWR